MEDEKMDEEVDSTYSPPFWYGLTNVLLSTQFLIITVLVAIAIRRHENYSKWASYQIMLCITLCDMSQLVAHVISGISLMLEWDMPNLLNIFLGSIMSGAWISSSIYGILLSVQRLFSVVFPLYESEFFTGKYKKIIFSSAHSTMLIFTAFQWTNWSHNIYYRKNFSWGYDTSLLLGKLFSAIDDYSVVPFILCAFVCYSMIFYTLKTKGSRRRMENVVTINVNVNLLQVFVYCVFCTCIFILWRFIEPLLEQEPVTYFWTSLPWIFYNGANGVTCLCLNKSIRGNVSKLLHCRRINVNDNRISVKTCEKSELRSTMHWMESITNIYKKISNNHG